MQTMSTSRPPRRRLAFTLVELLVVLTVVAVLAALLTPVIVQARAGARQTTCASHLLQLGHACTLYLQDYDERFPTCYWNSSLALPVDPPLLLQPYLQNWEILYCPERQTRLPECLEPDDPLQPNSRCMGYGYNWGSGLVWGQSFAKGDGLVRPAGSLSGPMIGVTLQEVVQPSHCLLMGDTNDFAFLTLLRNAMPGVRHRGDPAAVLNDVGQPYEPPRHSGGNNFLFVDGHVVRLPFHGGLWVDGGPWVVPDMSMYSRTGKWESEPVP